MPKGHHGYQWHRSKAGRKALSEAAKTSYKHRALIRKECDECGEIFESLDKRATSRFCSTRCRARAKYKRKPILTCEQCGGSYKKSCRSCALRVGYANGRAKRKPKKAHLVCRRGYRWIRRDGKYRQEHVAHIEAAIGRKLEKHEVVHHLNGDKLDNRLCNLLICSFAQHQRIHTEMAKRYQQANFSCDDPYVRAVELGLVDSDCLELNNAIHGSNA